MEIPFLFQLTLVITADKFVSGISGQIPGIAKTECVSRPLDHSDFVLNSTRKGDLENFCSDFSQISQISKQKLLSSTEILKAMIFGIRWMSPFQISSNGEGINLRFQFNSINENIFQYIGKINFLNKVFMFLERGIQR